MAKLKRYQVTMFVSVTKTAEVTARTKKEAYEKALEDAESPTLCHQCSDEFEMHCIDETVPHECIELHEEKAGAK